jgi:hypothetical protein
MLISRIILTPDLWMDLLGFKNIILEVKLSNKFKKINESFLESQKSHKISELPRR